MKGNMEGVAKRSEPREPERAGSPRAGRDGIQFDDRDLTPDERHLEIVRQVIWEKFRTQLAQT